MDANFISSGGYPVIDEADVLVVGGGFPGICAAVAAARAGASVILVERASVLGGQAASSDD